MNRDAAYALADEVVDAGYSCMVDIEVHANMAPPESCTVLMHAMRFESRALRELVEIGERHNVGLLLSGGGLMFLPGTS